MLEMFASSTNASAYRCWRHVASINSVIQIRPRVLDTLFQFVDI